MGRGRQRSARGEAGVTGVEYALLIALIGLIVGLAVGPMTDAVRGVFERQVAVPGPEICVGGNCSLTQGPFTLAYSANGATGSPPPAADYSFGSTVTVSDGPGLTKSGFTFHGWNTASDGGGQPYGAGQVFSMPGNDITLYAVWAGKYLLHYDGNLNTAGDAPTDSKSPYDSGSLVTLKAPGSLAKACSSYAGWNTKADGTGSWYAATGQLLMPASDVTLYAQWTALPHFTVTYDRNGGDGSVPVDGGSPYCGGSVVTVLGNTGGLTRPGFTFAGWNTASDGTGSSRAAGQTFSITGNTELFAQWTPTAPTQCTVTYIANGGVGTIPSASTACGHTLTLDAGTAFTRFGYHLLGWNTATDASGSAFGAGSTITLSKDLQLYATWGAQCPAALTLSTQFTKNGGSGTHDLGGDLPTGNPALLVSNVVKTGGVGTIAKTTGNTYQWTYPNGAKQQATATVSYAYAGQTCVATWSLSTP